VTASDDKTARLWDARNGSEIAVLEGHEDWVRGAAFSADGALVVTASDDKSARIWDARDGRQIAVIKGHTDTVRHAAFSPDGALVVTASEDNTVRLWDAGGGRNVTVLKGHEKAVHHAILSQDGQRIVTASEDKTARLWDAADGRQIAVLKGHAGDFVHAAFSPDGARLATAGGLTARLWDGRDGSEIAILNGHTGNVVHIAFSPDGALVVTASLDDTARIWDAREGRQIAVLRGHTHPVTHAAFSRDGARVVTASWDLTARVWSALDGQQIAVLKGHNGSVNHAAFSADGAFIVTGSVDQTARLWNARDGKQLAILDGHTNAVYHVAFSPDGALIVTASGDGTARLWDALQKRQIAILEGHDNAVSRAAFSPDGTRFVTAGGLTARLWDARDGKEIAVLKGHTADVLDAAFSHDGARIVTASSDHTARLWRVGPATDALVQDVKSAAPRCLTASQRQAAYLSVEPPHWCTQRGLWPHEAWAVALIERGGSLARSGKDVEAKALFVQVLARDPAAQKRIDDAWTKAFFERGQDLLKEPDDDAKGREQKQRDALALFEKAVVRLRKANTPGEGLADALYWRGRAHDALKQYRAAIDDFSEAGEFYHQDPVSWRWQDIGYRRWWATHGLASQMRDQSKTVLALLMVTLNGLDLAPELKDVIGRPGLKTSLSTLWSIISILHADMRKHETSMPVTGCDRVAHPHDPHRTAGGMPFAKIDKAGALAAVTACEVALKSYPDELRYRFQRARALTRLARLEEGAGDKAKASEVDAAAIDGLKAAAAGGYPVALNSLAFAYDIGEGVAKDEAKAADLYLEAFNRVVHCCWVPVARHLLEREGDHEAAQVRRVVHELLLWARALGSQPAGQILSELYAKGTLTPPASQPAVGKAAFTSLPPWLR
jgi:WD40 repeat protein